MRTRREQMQAYRFVIRRIVAAILVGEPETLDRPMRRLGLSLFVSAMIAVIGFVAFGIYGVLVNPGGDLEDSTIVIERGTGATYVYLDDRLHPVVNIASARLILGAAAEPRTVSPDSLVDTPRGPTLGIRQAPANLPEADQLIGLPWRVCSVPPGGARTEPTTTVVIDRGLTGFGGLAAEQGLYVSAGEQEYLLWNDQRLRIPDRAAAVALRLPPRPVPVGEPLINTISAGPDLAAPTPANAGQDSEFDLGGVPATIGQVFVASDTHYLLTEQGLARIGEVSWTLLQADGTAATTISATEAGQALFTGDVEPPGFPQTLPTPHPAGTGTGTPTVCTAYLGAEGSGPVGTRVEVSESAPEELTSGAEALEVAQTDRDPVTVADQVVIAGGRGALVQAVPHAGAAGAADTVYLVTDQGIKYPLGTVDVAARDALGYRDAEPVRIPAALLGMLPTGPELSHAAAMRPADLAAPD